MQISNEYKFIFFAVPKTATQSSWRTFRPYVDILDNSHVQPPKVKKEYPELWDSCFKFCFVRNPWDRMVSHYFYYLATIETWHTVLPRMLGGGSEISFQDYLYEHVLMGEPTGPKECNHCKEQTAWSDYVDYVARYENYKEEVYNIFNLIGIKEEPKFHLENKTEHKSYSEYYDDKSIMIVYEKFKEDIEMYNYEFGE